MTVAIALPLGEAPPVRARVLVVDNVEARRDFIARTLPTFGYDVEVAPAPSAAIGRFPIVDLVLLDVALPNGGTDALLRARAAMPTARDVPVLIVATPGDAVAIAHALTLGADDYVAEPFFAPLLRARAAACLERRQLRAAGHRLGHDLARELDIGREIQRGFLPAEMPVWPGWEIAAVFEAARQVSGDFYDAFYVGDGTQFGVVVGDVCGKGVGAALFMALFRTLIRGLATQMVHSGMTTVGNDAAERLFNALSIANDYIASVHGSANMFATAFAAAVNPRNGVVRWANAGHEPALIIGPDGGVRARLEPTGPALGLLPDVRLSTGEARLAPGESLLLSTDGVSEARDRAGGFFGDDRLEALCAQRVDHAADLAARVASAVHDFGMGSEPADDLTLLVVRRGSA